MASSIQPPRQANVSNHIDSASLDSKQEIENPIEVEIVEMPNHREILDAPPAKALPTRLKEDGVFLTWEDLWVTVSNGKSGSKSILQGLTGYARPGEVLAIMGPSGCGKSTLLDTLAGRLGSNTRQMGEVLINGHRQALAYGTSRIRILLCSTPITGLHVSVREEGKSRYGNKRKGLQDAMNTRIGGCGAKGLSGGQKRRVSICIEILTHPKLLFLDEPTSGLDSAASYYVMSRIVGLDQQDGRTIIASIHQPSTEVFQLFHNLCLLSSGRTIYFGPTSEANAFFTLNGFPCPALQNPSDHFLRTINKDFDEDIECGLGGKKPTEEVIDILFKSYKSSDKYQQVRRWVDDIYLMMHDFQDGGTLEKRNHAGFCTQCLVLTRRSFVNMFRDVGYYWLRLAIYVSLALALATEFYNLGFSYGSIQARGSLLMFVASYLTFMAIGGFPSFVEDMKVKHK
ncbi:hypothetical protein L1049_014966 [Liquidambar formosana]|uniref:ABC transporter domain-containing protein n=1 Tax=Liquidambar formosana TaxID=63359 RepID=A0AAP0X1K1_LIQFO